MRVLPTESGVELYPFDHPLKHIAVARPAPQYARESAEISWGASGPMTLDDCEIFLRCLIKAMSIARQFETGGTI
jgi:hypothetical protein